MTNTQLTLIFISSFFSLIILIDLYKIYILKKKKKMQYSNFLFIIFFNSFLFWDADYHSFLAESNRDMFDIPHIEKTMKLEYRSRFSEEWINKDTLKIKHASKIIKLGQSIEKESDYFTNKVENKTLRIITIFQVFRDKPKKEYALINGIIINEVFFEKENVEIMINEVQKDSILTVWKLN